MKIQKWSAGNKGSSDMDLFINYFAWILVKWQTDRKRCVWAQRCAKKSSWLPIFELITDLLQTFCFTKPLIFEDFPTIVTNRRTLTSIYVIFQIFLPGWGRGHSTSNNCHPMWDTGWVDVRHTWHSRRVKWWVKEQSRVCSWPTETKIRTWTWTFKYKANPVT